VNTLRVN